MTIEPQDREPRNLDDILSYLHRTRDHMDRYHHHKETLGWAGVVFYVGVSSLLLGLAPQRQQTPELLLAGVVMVAFVLNLSYVRRQFNLREYAGRVVRATERLILQIVSRDPMVLARLDVDFQPPDQPRASQGDRYRGFRLGPLFPGRLDDDDEPNQFNRPPILIETMRDARTFSTTKTDARVRGLEFFAYLLMILALGTNLMVTLK